ncbi:MAG: transketolase family protein [Candidatus Paceibacterota bacterium]
MNHEEGNINLNPELFKEGIEKESTRKGYGKGVLDAGLQDDRVVLLSADLTESTAGNFFADKFPERFVQVGVAEQNLVTVASGMAAMGKIPFINSYAVFSPGRNWEQIRTTVCYNDQPVKICGSHAGVTVGPDGGSHQALEDLALMRTLPNMVVLSPCDAIEAKKATIAAAFNGKPTYIRLARNATPIMTTEETFFEIGKASLFYGKSHESADVGVVATGPLLYKAIKAAVRIEKEKNLKVKVLNLSTIKPLDEEAVVALAKEAGAVVTVEEHQIHGGMGSVVSEVLARKCPTPMEFIGVDDVFGESGEADELIERFKIGEEYILNAILKVFDKK